MRLIDRCAAWLLLCLAFTANARAADTSVRDAGLWYLHPLSVVGDAVQAVGTAAGSVWTGIATFFGGSDPYNYLPSQISDDDRRFFDTLQALGLQLSEIKVGGGTFSHSLYRFVAAREPSDVDIQNAERKLEEYRASVGGLRAGAKQRIARAVLDVEGDRNFILTGVVVEMWPWPSANYEINARNRPPEPGERRVIDAAQPQ